MYVNVAQQATAKQKWSPASLYFYWILVTVVRKKLARCYKNLPTYYYFQWGNKNKSHNSKQQSYLQKSQNSKQQKSEQNSKQQSYRHTVIAEVEEG